MVTTKGNRFTTCPREHIPFNFILPFRQCVFDEDVRKEKARLRAMKALQPRRRLPKATCSLPSYKECAAIAKEHHLAMKVAAQNAAFKAYRRAMKSRYHAMRDFYEVWWRSHQAGWDGTWAGLVALIPEFGNQFPKPSRPSWRDQYVACKCAMCQKDERALTLKCEALEKRRVLSEEKRIQRKAFNHAKRFNSRINTRAQADAIFQRLFSVRAEPEEALEDEPLVEEEIPTPTGTPSRYVPRRKRGRKDDWETIDWSTVPYLGDVGQAREKSERISLRRQLRVRRAEGKATPVTVADFLKDSSPRKIKLSEITSQNQPRLFVEMDGEKAEGAIQDQAANVVIQDAVQEEPVRIGHKLTNLRKYCETKTTTNPDDMDRWYDAGRFTWNKTDTKGTDLFALRLPWDMLYEAKEVNKVKTIEFKQNVLVNHLRIRQFMQTDLDIKVEINSSPFMTGQCQVGWWYLDYLDKHFDLRNNNVTISQTAHTILDAANANPVLLRVPYRNYRTYLNVYPREDLDIPRLGVCVIKVLTPLEAPNSCAPSVDVTVFVKFSNCVMMGMIPPNLVKLPTPKENVFVRQALHAEMFQAFAFMEMTRYLRQRFADTNRDLPPNPATPATLVPIASGSLSYGTNDIEPVLSLRLDPLGQTPHPEGVPDDMLVSTLVSKFSYIYSVDIKTTDVNATRVMCEDAAPVLRLGIYSSESVSGTICYRFPPVAVVSQLFSYWRGDIEFRCDFVASRFHQLRLYFCWVPGYDKTVTYEQAKSCAGTYYDLKEDNRSVTIIVPYISDRPWWPHRYSNGVDADEVPAPSQFCCFVVNKLTCTDAVAKKVKMNVYMRGGKNFEVSIPCQPMIGLPFNAKFSDRADESIQARPGYFPWYAGTWRNVEGGNKLVIRYGNVTDHIAQFSGLKVGYYYKFQDGEVGKTMTVFKTATYSISGNSLFFVPVSDGDSLGYSYLGVCETLAKVKLYYYVKEGTVWKKLDKPNPDFLMDAGVESSNTYYSPGSVNAYLVPTFVDTPVNELVTEIDNRDMSVNKITFEPSPSDTASLDMFGETFFSLKDLCRRYQLYTRFAIFNLQDDLCQSRMTIPLLPQGLDLDISDDVVNSCRDGIIPLILSGYRFFRGGLRFKIISKGSVPYQYMVQVRPDRRVATKLRAGGVTVASSFMQHGYASSIQCGSVNPVMTVEVPFYISGSSGILQRPSAEAIKNQETSRFYTLGEMSISVSAITPNKTDFVSFDIYYSIADDFSAHTFQGFPPMLLVKDAGTSKVSIPRGRLNSDSSFEVLDGDC